MIKKGMKAETLLCWYSEVEDVNAGKTKSKVKRRIAGLIFSKY